MQTASTLADVMKAPVVTLPPEVPAMRALEFAEQQGVHHFPVIEGDEIRGVVCTCDLDDIDLRAPIGIAIQRAAVTIHAGATLSEAVRVMSTEAVGSLLVTDHGVVLGIVTREDLAEAGVDVDDAPGFRCASCGAIKHLKTEGEKGMLCADCRAHSGPETPQDETGVAD